MQVTDGADDVVLYHTAGWQSSSALSSYGGTTFDLRVPLLQTDGQEYFYLRFRRSHDGSNTNYAYFLLLEKLQ